MLNTSLIENTVYVGVCPECGIRWAAEDVPQAGETCWSCDDIEQSASWERSCMNIGSDSEYDD